MDFLERAVTALKLGKTPQSKHSLDHGAEIDLHVPALIPEEYLPDVHERLILYKRIASAGDFEALENLQVEMIDRFGLLPESIKNLFRITALKLKANRLGVRKVELGAGGGRILFQENPTVSPNAIVALIQSAPDIYRFDGGDKLRITRKLTDGIERIRHLETVLTHLEAGYNGQVSE